MPGPDAPASLDIAAIRRDFPITETIAYLDNAGVAPTPRPVIDAIHMFLQEYSAGGLMRHWDYFEEIVTGVQTRFGALFGAEPEELAPIAHTSEGVNTVAHMLDLRRGDNVVVNDLEFPSNFYPWLNLRRRGVEVRIARNHDGVLGLPEIQSQVDARTRVITVTSVAFLNGCCLDVEAIATFARERGIYTMLDATQALGALRVDLHRVGVDFMACSGMKWLLGPLGTGILYCRKDLLSRFTPTYVSWLSLKERRPELQQNLVLSETARRFMLSGNIDLAAFCGFGAALDYLQRIGPAVIERRVLSLTDRLIAGVQRLGLPIASPLEAERRSAIVAFRVPDPEAVFQAFGARRIRAAIRMGAVRISPHLYNTDEEIDRVIAVLEDTTT